MQQDGWVEPEIWYAQLPSFYAAAAALITDPAGRVLLVKPSYRNHWAFPGGYVEADEYPHHTCHRGLQEVLGLSLPVGELLVVDWAPPAGQRPRPIISLTFDCGMLDEPTQPTLVSDELEAWDFLTPAEAAHRLPPNSAGRVAAGLGARESQRTAYLCGGNPANT